MSDNTFLIDGQAIDAARISCDPPPGASSAPVLLCIRLEQAKADPPSSASIVFPFAGELYGGDFRLLSRSELAGGEVEYTFVSEGAVLPEPDSWARQLVRVLKWRARGRAPRPSE